MKRCRTCVTPDTRPDTHFDETGQCSACRTFNNRTNIDWESRRKELIELLDRHDGRCIVPSSGGKDSHYQVMTLLGLGADVTIVTATTCHLTSIGRHNIDNLARYARTIEVSPNKKIRAKLNRIGLEMVGDISWPEHASIFSVPFRYSCHLKIPLIFYGESPQAEYGGPKGTEQAREMTRRWVTEFGGFLGLRPSDFIGMEGIIEHDMMDYEIPTTIELDSAKVESHFLGQYIPWDSHKNADVAKLAGMITSIPCNANIWPFENLDNAQTGIHDFLMFLKYGYGRATMQASVDIRNGRMTRDDAMNFIRRKDGWFPDVYGGVTFQEVIDRIGVSEETFWNIAEQFTNKELFHNAGSPDNPRPVMQG